MSKKIATRQHEKSEHKQAIPFTPASHRRDIKATVDRERDRKWPPRSEDVIGDLEHQHGQEVDLSRRRGTRQAEIGHKAAAH